MLISQTKQRNTLLNHTTGTNAGATATALGSANSGKRHYILFVSGWTDAASLVQIKKASTVLVEFKVEADKPFHFKFDGDLFGDVNGAVSAVIATSTADCSVSIGTALF